MRRVYYAFFLRFLSHPIITHGAIAGVSFLALANVVSIPSIFSNMLEVRVGDVMHFFVSALLNTQSVTIVLLAIISLTLLSLVRRLFKDRRFDMHMSGGAEMV